MLKYKVIVASVTKHTIKIEMTMDKAYQLTMAAWVPGSYMIREFSRHIISINAHNSVGSNLELTKISKNSWQIEESSDNVTVSYELYCFDTAPRGAYLDQNYAFLDACRMFIWPVGYEGEIQVELLKPQKDMNEQFYSKLKNWQAYCNLLKQKVDRHGFGTYTAQDYYTLIDNPIMLGEPLVISLSAGNTPHEFVIFGKSPTGWDKDRLANDTQKICQGHIDFFGELPTMDRYTFYTNVLTNGYGGIEHNNCSSLITSQENLPVTDNSGEVINSQKYNELLGLISHEYFHLWNVRRIKPESLLNPDLSKEAYTKQLWIFEGVTSYYDNFNLLRSQTVSLENYLTLLATEITNYLQNPGTYLQNLEDSSFDAWIKFYIRDENSVNQICSYYGKGSLVALCLDLQILSATDGKTSLRNIMRYMWHEYGAKNIGVPEGEFEEIVNKDLDCRKFFEFTLRSTESMQQMITQMLSAVGIVCELEDESLVRSLGIRLGNDQNNNPQVVTVFADSIAQQMGIAAKDTLIALDGMRIGSKLENMLANYPAGQELSLTLFRESVLQELMIVVPDKQKLKCKLKLCESPSPEQTELRGMWLSTQ